MKVSLTQENLNKALQVVGRVVGSRTSLPVLANVLLATDNNRLKLSSTNLEIGINYWVGVKVEKEGAITVPARLLSDFINSLPSGENIALELEKHTLNIQAAQYKSSINGIDSEEFPSIPQITKGNSFKLSGSSFSEAIEQVVGVAAVDDARPVLSGVYLKAQDKSLVLVATDSYRLAEKKIELGTALKDPIEVIIPARTLQELDRVITESSEEVEVLVDESQIMFKFGEVELVSRLIEGEFPKYESLIPEKSTTTFQISREEFIRVAKVAHLFARESAGSVSLSVNPAKNEVKLASIASQVGENTSVVKAEAKGEEIDVSLNCRYLLDALEAAKSEEVTFGVTGKINPCVVKPQTKSDYQHIIMPLRS